MGKVSICNRISAILLSSDTAMTCEEISSQYPGRNKPTRRTIAQLLSSYSEFIVVGCIRVKRLTSSTTKVFTWTHIDHDKLNPQEEE